MDDVARDIHRSLLLRNESTKQLVIESIYKDTPESRHNIEAWSTAPDLKSARPFIQKVHGSRLSDKFVASRHTSLSSYSPYPRASTTRSTESSSSWSNVYGGGRSNLSAGANPTLRSSSSPSSDGGTSRKVVSDFSSFIAGGTLSVSGSQGSQRKDTAFYGGARDTRNEDDDDDDEGFGGPSESNFGNSGRLPVAVENEEGALEVAGDDGSTLRLRMGAISLDQARRLAMQSAYRGGLA